MTTLKIRFSNQLRRDLKLMVKRGYREEKFSQVVKLLAQNKGIPGEYKDHPLRGKWSGFRECHIEFDWILIYRIIEDELTLVITRTGTHNDMFKN